VKATTEADDPTLAHPWSLALPRYDEAVIRLLTASEAPEVAVFYAEIRRDTVPAIHTVDEIAEWIVTRLLPRGSSFVWEEEGTLLAWLDVHDGWVNQLFCRRDATGRGLGRRLLDFAKDLSPHGLQLYTFQVNDGARRFYAREGFIVYAREGFIEVEWGDGSGNEESEPDVRMTWSPAP